MEKVNCVSCNKEIMVHKDLQYSNSDGLYCSVKCCLENKEDRSYVSEFIGDEYVGCYARYVLELAAGKQ